MYYKIKVVGHWCSYHILTSSVHLHCTGTGTGTVWLNRQQQNGIYLCYTIEIQDLVGFGGHGTRQKQVHCRWIWHDLCVCSLIDHDQQPMHTD